MTHGAPQYNGYPFLPRFRQSNRPGPNTKAGTTPTAVRSRSTTDSVFKQLGREISRNRHCERSEAIHGSTKASMDCFVVSLLAMTSKICVRVLAAGCARVVQASFRLRDQRAQGMPGAQCARSLA